MKFIKLFLTLMLLCGLSSAQVYYAQTQAGSHDGSSCANAIAQSALSCSAGTTYHICGTISSPLTIGCGGTSGSPVNFVFEGNAKYSADHWGNNLNAITSNNKDWINFDGGPNGVMEATNNGTSPTYGFQDDETAIDLGNCNNCTIHNIACNNFFVKTTNDTQGSSECFHLIGSNNKIYNNTMHDVGTGVGYNYPGGGTISNGQIYGNIGYHMNQGIAVGDTGSGATFNGLLIHDNEDYDAVNWDNLPENHFHHNGVIAFITNDDSKITGLQIYNQYTHGDMGSQETGHIFLDQEGNGSVGGYSGALIYNNLLIDNSTVNTPSNGFIITKANGGTPAVKILNNTFLFQPSQKNRCIMNQGAGLTIENSIGSNCGFNVYNPSGTITLSDYNDWYLSSGSDASEGVHSITTNPLLSGTYFPGAGSPVLAAALNLSSLSVTALDSDKSGSARPGSGQWDMGVYQGAHGGIDDTLSGWTTCVIGTCPAGGTPGGTGTAGSPSLTINNASPSLDGASMLMSFTAPSTSGSTNMLATYKAGADENALSLSFDGHFFIPSNCALIGQFEFDQFIFRTTDSIEYMFGTQWNKATGKWQVFNQNAGTWVDTTVTTALNCNAWNEVAETAHRVAGDTSTCSGHPCLYYDSLAINGVLQTGYATTQPAGTLPGGFTSNTGFQFQMDVLAAGTSGASVNENFDEGTFTVSDSGPGGVPNPPSNVKAVTK